MSRLSARHRGSYSGVPGYGLGFAKCTMFSKIRLLNTYITPDLRILSVRVDGRSLYNILCLLWSDLKREQWMRINGVEIYSEG